MKSPDGKTASSWYARVTIPKYRKVPRTTKTDACIVGAGIAGLTTAYMLAREGKSVIVLDEGEVGSGQTGRTSAHLTSAIDDRFIEIERLHGVETSRLAYESHAAAIDGIERICKEEKINCDFARINGYLSLGVGDCPDLLDRELAAARRAGMKDVKKLRNGGLGGPCLRFGRQARFHPMQYVVGLAAVITRLGGKIYTGERVKDVQGSDPKKKSLAYAQLKGNTRVTANHVVVATNTPAPINDWFGIYTKQASYRSYVITALIPRGSVEDALYWDTGDPYHYVRLQKVAGQTNDLLVIGGEDHKTGQLPPSASPFAELESWAREKFPTMGRVKHRWSGQVQEPADGLGFIGRALTDKENVFVATGDSGMGLTHGTIAGILITDLIMQRANSWEKVYDPSRKLLNLEFLRENTNTLAQYKDLVSRGDVAKVQDIPPGEGAVIRDGMSKLAVYRDPKGKLHRHSALCTHLKCIVQWNRIEDTWDCPCHGSRFDPMGKVLMGPAIDDLKSMASK